MSDGSKQASKFIPNSFQTPNAYVDEYMYLLTPEEWSVLSYAARRIFGFNKRQDRISIPQFYNGITANNGSQLDHGTGLSESTIKRCLINLVKFGLMLRLAENDPSQNNGVLWGLQLESEKVDLAGLETRKVETVKLNERRTKAARKGGGGYAAQPHGMSDIPRDVGQPHGGDVGQPHGGDVGQPTQYPVETQGNTEGLMPDCTSVPAMPSTTREIQDAYCALLGYKPDDWSSGEAKAAKSIAEHWTVEQLKRAYRHLKAQPFWRDKRVTLRYLKQQMPEILRSENGSHNSDADKTTGGDLADRARLSDVAARINARNAAKNAGATGAV